MTETDPSSKDIPEPDAVSIAETASTGSSIEHEAVVDSRFCRKCGSCERHEDGNGCEVTCQVASALPCHAREEKLFTICQVRRHNHADSTWLVAGDRVYDATSILRGHPGGADCILRKAGGVVDCTQDLQFHSKSAIRMWKRHEIGRLRRCSCTSQVEEKQWWMFWSN